MQISQSASSAVRANARDEQTDGRQDHDITGDGSLPYKIDRSFTIGW